MYFDIKQSRNWKSAVSVSKGWSRDKKYLITTDKDEDTFNSFGRKRYSQ